MRNPFDKEGNRIGLVIWVLVTALWIRGLIANDGGIGWIICILLWTVSIVVLPRVIRYTWRTCWAEPVNDIPRNWAIFGFTIAPIAVAFLLLLAWSELWENTALYAWLKGKTDI